MSSPSGFYRINPDSAAKRTTVSPLLPSIAAAALIWICPVNSQAEVGPLEASFKASVTGGPFTAAAPSSAVQQDDKVLAGGAFTGVNATPRARIARLVGTSTAVAPSITTQPQSQTVTLGSSLTLNVVASGTGPLSYQWRKDGVNMAGATNSSYSIAAVLTNNAGAYRVLVSYPGGTLTSAEAVLSVARYSFTTLAGLANIGAEDGIGSAARFYHPHGVAVDSGGNLYVADRDNHTIRKVTSAGVVTTLAGLAGSSGSTDGTGSTARFNGPRGVAADSAGNVYVADSENHTIRKVTLAGVVTTLAGLAGGIGSANGTGNTARFYRPRSVAVDSAGNVYVADYYNHTIRKVTPSGVVTTLAGLALRLPRKKRRDICPAVL